MKKYFSIYICSIACLMLMFSCAKDDDNNSSGGGGGQNPGPQGFFEYSINGGDSVVADIALGDFVNGFISVAGSSADTSEFVSLAIGNFAGVANYPIVDGAGNNGVYVNNTGAFFFAPSTSGGGNISISVFDATDSIVSGTFNFIGEGPSFSTVSVEGSFDGVSVGGD